MLSPPPSPTSQPPPHWPFPREAAHEGIKLEGKNQHAEFTHMQEKPGSRIGQAQPLPRRVNRRQSRLVPDPREVDSGITALEMPLASDDSSSSSSLGDASSSVSVASAPAAAASSVTASSARRRRPEMGTVSDLELARAEQLKRNDDNFRMAQRYHPAEAIVFVGNLPSDRTDAELSKGMMDLFGSGGMAHVRVGRSYGAAVEKPWALLQFANFADADRAIIEGNQAFYGGRRLRCEASRTCCELFVRRRDFGIYTDCHTAWILEHDFGWCGDIDTMTWDGGVGYAIRFRCFGAYELARQAVASGTTEYVFN